MTNTLLVASFTVALLLLLLGTLKATKMSLQNFILLLVGTIIGLLLGALISIPLANLPAPFGSILPLLASIAITFMVILLVFSQRANILHIVPMLKIGPDASGKQPTVPGLQPVDEILVDTSVIIDGRVADIATAGFIRAKLLIPRFVLAELQNIADSDDAMRRGRGRRGLDILQSIRETSGLETEIIEDDVSEIKEVDAKLVALAQRRHCDVLTTDYNLNRVAQIEGVRVLNINELANAIRPVVIPGEQLMVKVVQAGKERGQGVGYLADGTMIVVDQGDKLIGEEIPTEVTRVFQTVAGKMIFAMPLKSVKDGLAASAPKVSRSTKSRDTKESKDTKETTVKDTAPKSNNRPKSNKRFRPQSQIEQSLIEQTNGVTVESPADQQ
jgi:uncharacterized protein YacL